MADARQAQFLDAGLIEVDEGDEGDEIGNANFAQSHNRSRADETQLLV